MDTNFLLCFSDPDVNCIPQATLEPNVQIIDKPVVEQCMVFFDFETTSRGLLLLSQNHFVWFMLLA